MKHRICILTQPLTNGFGGLLQNYALQTTLKREGHDVWTEDRRQNASMFERFFDWVKKALAPIYGPILTPFTHIYYNSHRIVNIINSAPTKFKKKYITTTSAIYSNSKSKLNKYEFDTYIVGSDQVWRPRYSFGPDSIYNYFLDFTKAKKVKRIAFSASFGVTHWEFSDDETLKCGELLRKFDAVSVREDSGIEMCKKYFNVDAVQTLDPTLLLLKKDYEALVNQENEKPFEPCVFTYFLDSTIEKKRIAQKVADKFGINVTSIMPTEYFYNVGLKGLDKCKYSSVTKWLRAYMDAKFIVTDSFHGTVFSIIFNKPFIAIGNVDRGLSRFSSLLKLFGLEDRLVTDYAQVSEELIEDKIDFDKVNSIKDKEIKKTIEFLRNALK